MTSLAKIRRLFIAIFLISGVLVSGAQAATGTIMPTPFQTFLDSNGNPISGGKVCTYIAGTTTATATYTDAGLTIQNGNPIVTDVAGRFTAYLSPGASYKFIYQNNDGTANTCNGSVIKTVDNVSAVPASSANLDITGTAGEALTAGLVVYLSDGSGSKTAGQWFKADSANTYSSTTAEVGMTTAAISSGVAGSIRIAGAVTGLSSLTIGTTYYVGSSGALTSTQPANSRVIGVADTTSSLVLGAPPPVIPTNLGDCGLRATLTTGTPYTTADVTAATSIFVTPVRGGQCAFFNGSATWTTLTNAEVTISVPATTSQMYDIWCRNNAGTIACDTTAWTNDTTRATALTTQNNVYVKTGDTTRRYIASFRTTTVSGQTEDSLTKRYVWSYYNRVSRMLQRYESTASWTYTTATVRQANAAAANQIDVITGVAESPMDLALSTSASGSTDISAGIGEDSTTTYAVGQTVNVNSSGSAIVVRLIKIPTVGRHFYSWNEWSTAVGTTTWNGATAARGSTITSGLSGSISG